MRSNLAVLLLLVLAHGAFGAEYGRFPLTAPESDGVLLWYLVASHALLVLWAYLDSRVAARRQSLPFLLAIAVFGFLAMPFYLGATRPSGTWVRWLPLSLAYFVVCIVVFGQAFQWTFQAGRTV